MCSEEDAPAGGVSPVWCGTGVDDGFLHNNTLTAQRCSAGNVAGKLKKFTDRITGNWNRRSLHLYHTDKTRRSTNSVSQVSSHLQEQALYQQ